MNILSWLRSRLCSSLVDELTIALTQANIDLDMCHIDRRRAESVVISMTNTITHLERDKALLAANVNELINDVGVAQAHIEALEYQLADMQRDTLAFRLIPYWNWIKPIASEFKMDSLMLAGVVSAESSFRSVPGDGGDARGIAQMHSITWRDMYGPTANWIGAWDIEPSIRAIALYRRRYTPWLNLYWSITDSKWLWACYNTGTGNIKKHLDAGLGWEQLSSEVRKHVARYFAARDYFRQQLGIESRE